MIFHKHSFIDFGCKTVKRNFTPLNTTVPKDFHRLLAIMKLHTFFLILGLRQQGMPLLSLSFLLSISRCCSYWLLVCAWGGEHRQLWRQWRVWSSMNHGGNHSHSFWVNFIIENFIYWVLWVGNLLHFIASGSRRLKFNYSEQNPPFSYLSPFIYCASQTESWN